MTPRDTLMVAIPVMATYPDWQAEKWTHAFTFSFSTFLFHRRAPECFHHWSVVFCVHEKFRTFFWCASISAHTESPISESLPGCSSGCQRGSKANFSADWGTIFSRSFLTTEAIYFVLTRLLEQEHACCFVRGSFLRVCWTGPWCFLHWTEQYNSEHCELNTSCLSFISMKLFWCFCAGFALCVVFISSSPAYF